MKVAAATKGQEPDAALAQDAGAEDVVMQHRYAKPTAR